MSKRNIERLGTFGIMRVLSEVWVRGDLRRKKRERYEHQGHSAKLSSKRLTVFCVSGIRCIKCGIEGAFFAMEKHANDGSPHLEMYAVNTEGEEVLMTKDHIVPKSKGGSDKLDNLQTMCAPCNVAKGNQL